MKLNPAYMGLKKARIEMLPLIDIVFLVLVVFIYTMLSMAVHRSLPVALPHSAAAEIDRDSRLSLSVMADGSLLLNRQLIKPDELQSVLAARADESPPPAVLLSAAHDLDYQRLFEVLDLIRQAGIERVSLQAEKAARP